MSTFREPDSPAAVAALTAEGERRQVIRSAGVVSVAVLASRVLGLVREQVFAAYFGAGFLNDAFQVGLRILGPLRDLFAEGALSVAFVKTFTDYSVRRGEDAAWRHASMVLNALLVVLSVVVLAGVFFAPQIVGLIAGDFSAEKAALAVTLTRIMFPFLLLIALAAVAMGVLNTKGRFAVPASASMMFNVGAIAGGLLFAYWLSGGGWTSVRDPGAVPDSAAQWAIIGMAIGTLIGGGLQFLIQLPSLLGVGFRYRPLLSFNDPGVRQVMRLMGPAVVGTAAVQVNVLVNTYFAASIDGGPSWLGYAFRLMQFPIGLFGIAVGTAVYPTITRYAVEDNLHGFRSMLSSSLGLVFLLTVPSACGLVVLARPIAALIYERGAFTAGDTRMVAAALAAYAVGLAGYAAIKVLLPAFYALGDARTPMLTSLLSIVVNVALGSVLMDWLSGYGVTAETPRGYAHAGPALATSCVVLLNFAVLSLLMRRRLTRLEGRRILSSFVRIALASAALSVASLLTYRALAAALGEASLGARLAVVAGSIAVGGAVFFASARLLSVRELSMAVGAITERLRKGGKD